MGSRDMVGDVKPVGQERRRRSPCGLGDGRKRRRVRRHRSPVMATGPTPQEHARYWSLRAVHWRPRLCRETQKADQSDIAGYLVGGGSLLSAPAEGQLCPCPCVLEGGLRTLEPVEMVATDPPEILLPVGSSSQP